MNWQRSVLVVALAALGSSSCAKATHLVYVYDLSIGVDVAYSNEGSARMVFGYDRGTYAIVPQRQDQLSQETPENGELMSLAAISNIDVQGLDGLKFEHFVSTGEAAKDVAKDADGLAKIRKAIFGK